MIEQELRKFEEVIQDAVMRTVPQYGRIVLALPVVNKKIEDLENFLELYMNPETGEVNGRELGKVFEVAQPEISQWVNVPRQNFKPSEMAENLVAFLIGG